MKHRRGKHKKDNIKIKVKNESEEVGLKMDGKEG